MSNTLNGYICFYKNYRFECRAPDPHAALRGAAKHFKLKPGKTHAVDVRLAELGDRKVAVVE